jgi:hypothetical protein
MMFSPILVQIFGSDFIEMNGLYGLSQAAD